MTNRHAPEYLEKKAFEIVYPASNDGDVRECTFTQEQDRMTIVHGCIRMMDELDLPWIHPSTNGWSRALKRGALWLTRSGLLISSHRSTFREGLTETDFLSEGKALQKTSFGWGFMGADEALDGMTFRYISYQLRPLLHKYFQQSETLEYHLYNEIPDIPDWLDAECFDEAEALVVYGSTELQR